MAKMSVKGLDDLNAKLEAAADHAPGLCKACVWEGAKVVTDKIRANLSGLPTESWRPKNTTGEPYNVLTPTNKADLAGALGIDEIKQDGGGASTVIGFSGYGSAPSKKYPNGLPNPLLARAVESGSSARAAHPFVRPAVNSSKGAAQAAMDAKASEFIGKIMK